MADTKDILAAQFREATDPFADSLKSKVADLIGPATEKATAALKPYIEDTLVNTILPRVALWGGLALVVSVAVGAAIGSHFATRRRVYRTNPRRWRRAS